MRPRTWKETLLSLILIIALFAGITLVSIFIRTTNPVVLVVLAVLAYLGTALNRARQAVNPPRFPLFRDDPGDYGLEYFEDVEFDSKDGVPLSGWYIPSKTGSAVILTHSWGGDRTRMRFYARPLAQAGIGVLMYDLRGHCRSGGAMSTWGWEEIDDLLGALDWIAERPDVEQGRIGAAGVSLGAQITLRAASLDHRLRAIWADGPIPASIADHRSVQPTLRQQLLRPWFGLVYRTQSWLTGASPNIALLDAIPAIAPRPLQIVASGKDNQVHMVRGFFDLAEEPKDLWQLDNVPFGAGVVERGEDYDLRLVHFFNHNLEITDSAAGAA
jgi:pimeloyl-ACP methyl ester carboxylesterase